jgi:hypothetical protein
MRWQGHGYGEAPVDNRVSTTSENRCYTHQERETYNLSGIQPGHTKPSNGKEGIEHEQEHNSGDTSFIVLLEAGRNSQDGHGDGHTNSTNQHERSSANLLNNEDGDPRGNKVLGTVAGCENTGHESTHTNAVFVDVGCVVGNQIDTRDLLEHPEKDKLALPLYILLSSRHIGAILVDIGQDNTVEMAILVHSEKVTVTSALSFQNSVLDCEVAAVDIRIIMGQITQSSQDNKRLIFLPLQDQPPRTLRKTEHDSQNNQGKDDLECDREAPRDGGGLQEGECEIQPVTDTDTTSDKSTLDHDKLTTAMRFRTFRLPRWHRGCVETISNTGDDTTDDKVREFESRALQSSTDNHDCRSNEDSLATSQNVTNPDTRYGTAETADIVGCNGNSCKFWPDQTLMSKPGIW